MATKKEAKTKSKSVATTLKKQGLRMPHGYEVVIRKKRK